MSNEMLNLTIGELVAQIKNFWIALRNTAILSTIFFAIVILPYNKSSDNQTNIDEITGINATYISGYDSYSKNLSNINQNYYVIHSSLQELEWRLKQNQGDIAIRDGLKFPTTYNIIKSRFNNSLQKYLSIFTPPSVNVDDEDKIKIIELTKFDLNVIEKSMDKLNISYLSRDLTEIDKINLDPNPSRETKLNTNERKFIYEICNDTKAVYPTKVCTSENGKVKIDILGFLAKSVNIAGRIDLSKYYDNKDFTKNILEQLSNIYYAKFKNTETNRLIYKINNNIYEINSQVKNKISDLQKNSRESLEGITRDTLKSIYNVPLLNAIRLQDAIMLFPVVISLLNIVYIFRYLSLRNQLTQLINHVKQRPDYDAINDIYFSMFFSQRQRGKIHLNNFQSQFIIIYIFSIVYLSFDKNQAIINTIIKLYKQNADTIYYFQIFVIIFILSLLIYALYEAFHRVNDKSKGISKVIEISKLFFNNSLIPISRSVYILLANIFTVVVILILIISFIYISRRILKY